MSLNGKVAVVAGGAGRVGRGIVYRLLEAGATVVVPSRGAERLAALGRELGRLATTDRFVPLVAALDDEDGAGRAHDAVLARFGRLDLLVTSLGGWHPVGPLLSLPRARWDAVLRDNLTSHFVAARAFLPALLRSGDPSPSYTMLGGTSSEHPYPGAAPNSVAGTARLMLADALALELRGTPVRVNALVLPGVDTAGIDRAGGGPGHLTNYDVGDFIAWLATDGAAIRGARIRLMGAPPGRDWQRVPGLPQAVPA